MAATTNQRAPTLMRALGFNAEDLEANRAGRLGRNQIRTARVFGGIWLLMGALFLLAMAVGEWAEQAREGHGAADVIAPFVFAVLISGFCFLTGGRQVLSRRPHMRVTRLTGTVRPAEKAPYWYAGETRFKGPGSGASNWSNPIYALLKDKPECNVYVVGGEAVSIELSL